MTSLILLDTDTCIEILRGNPKPIEAYSGSRFVVSAITRFEIRSGLRKRRSRKLEDRANAFLQNAEILPFDDEAADAAARTRIELEAKGTPIGAYDTLLAGQALALKAPILTGNVSEFSRIKGLKVLSWQQNTKPKTRNSQKGKTI